MADEGSPTLAQFEAWEIIWPLSDRQRMIAPVRSGMDRRTGKMLVGFDHVMQSMEVIFATRFHERILRQWAGSFVEHLLGQNITGPTITRFWWAIIAAIDLWEPGYSIKNISLRNGLNIPTSSEGIRRGEISFQSHGVYYPRGHLGDFTPDAQRGSDITGRGDSAWIVSPVNG